MAIITSKNQTTHITHETDESYACRAATIQDIGTNPQSKHLSLSFNNRTGLSVQISRGLKYIRHDLANDGNNFTISLYGSGNIIVGLKALFKLESKGWVEDMVSKPLISSDMQTALLRECSDFIISAENAPIPSEF